MVEFPGTPSSQRAQRVRICLLVGQGILNYIVDALSGSNGATLFTRACTDLSVGLMETMHHPPTYKAGSASYGVRCG